VQVNVLKDDSLVALQGLVHIINYRAKVGRCADGSRA
jgi:hypothetical protein